MLTVKEKQTVIEKHKIHKTDTGSPEVQVAILTKQIDELTKHLKKHKKDNHSRKGLLKMVAERKAFMNYLAKKDPKRYDSLAKKIGLKSVKK